MKYLCALALIRWSGAVQAESFNDWLAGYKIRAVQTGLPQSVVDHALRDVEYDDRVIELDQKQPETQQTLQEYLDRAVTRARIDKGHEMLVRYHSILHAVQERTGVPPEILIALWGRETEYGAYTGDFETTSSLATLAYEGRRRAFFVYVIVVHPCVLN